MMAISSGARKTDGDFSRTGVLGPGPPAFTVPSAMYVYIFLPKNLNTVESLACEKKQGCNAVFLFYREGNRDLRESNGITREMGNCGKCFGKLLTMIRDTSLIGTTYLCSCSFCRF